MESYVCHDLKNQQGEISSGLPPALKVVPILFYVSAVLCTGAMGWFEWQTRQATDLAALHAANKAKIDKESSTLSKEKVQLELLNARAAAVSTWLEGAVNLQPVSVAINRAAGEDAVISELSLNRNTQIPSQVHLSLKVGQADSRVIDATLQGIRDLSFRPYSAQQTKDGDQLDYKATLVWQGALLAEAEDESKKEGNP